MTKTTTSFESSDINQTNFSSPLSCAVSLFVDLLVSFFEIQLKYEGIFLKLFKRLQKNVYLLCVFWVFLNLFFPVSVNISVYICNYLSLQMQFSTILKPAGYTRFLSSFLS